MQVEFNCYQATIQDIEPGVFFAAAVGGETTFCLSVQPDSAQTAPNLLTLWPGHPGLKNKIGLLNGSVISGQPILVYPEAKIVPSPNSRHLRLDPFRSTPVGSLLIKENEFFIQAATGNGSKAYSCRNGAASTASVAPFTSVLFASWEIMIAGPGGEPHTLCVIDVTVDESHPVDIFS
ncbi:MAG: hypothetical protein KJ947_15810 [Alphaproteobacteria bacterium]|nr:hypothetical protein [Alphaproteobacteria bacterium]MBU1551026.1 hypothetical protein [Alphaproteobacteria bacterium]MBU2339162.1 hypothetical protein [Alphaproteobacteria bacterium]MBU2387253.1 hypothetical protein [Alphaproteobacteria bacterium]|tara:strand:+ start:465 stop:998 length:534 start_codon:yes stop_codon:yes gene_type:complete